MHSNLFLSIPSFLVKAEAESYPVPVHNSEFMGFSLSKTSLVECLLYSLFVIESLRDEGIVDITK